MGKWMIVINIDSYAFIDHAQVVGTGRMLTCGKIGRMAVLRAYRQKGIGRALLTSLFKRVVNIIWLEFIWERSYLLFRFMNAPVFRFMAMCFWMPASIIK